MTADDWRIGWRERRNRLLASPRFQRFAARFPLTRPIARHKASQVFDLVAGFVYSQTLVACLDTGLLARLAQGGATSEELARELDLPLPATDRLLKAAAALDLVEAVGERWTLGPAGAALSGNPGIAAMVAHHRALYADLANPIALLQRNGGGGALSRYWTYAESPGAGDAGDVADYSALMAASNALVVEQALAAYDFRRHDRLLDVGGGEGAFLRAIGPTAPKLALGLFDLPAVVERARARLEDAGLAGRTSFHPGDFTRDPLPTGYDLVTLVRILHDHDDAVAARLLRAIHTALPADGRLLIVEPMAGTAGARRVGDAYFGFYLLAMGSGRPRTPEEIRAMLADAGFRTSRTIPTPLPLAASVIVATA